MKPNILLGGSQSKTAGKPPKKNGKTIKRLVLVALVAVGIGAAVWGIKQHGKTNDTTQVLTDFVSRGAITTTVEGNGTTLPQNSASIALPTAGKVQEVFVTEGQTVTKGTPLFRVQSDTMEEAVTSAKKDVEECRKTLEKLQADQSKLVTQCPYAGRILDVQAVKVGDTVAAGDKVAFLADDSKLRLSQYYSYAYENDIRVGQTVTVSLPAAMTQVTGTVEAVRKVRRVSETGSVLFAVDVVMNNPGALTAGMTASASLTTSAGEPIYPYEAGKLEYNRSGDITAGASGTVEQINLMDYAGVAAGQTLLVISDKDSQDAIAAQNKQLAELTETLKQAQDELAKLSAVAPIDGTVTSVGITAGQEPAAGTVAVSIADTSVMLVNAKIDERNIAYIQTGMQVDLDQWGVTATGTVTSVSLNGTIENGVSSFPVIITVDNATGQLTNGGSVTFTFAASQSEDCLMVPIQCVKSAETEEGGVSVVFVRTDNPPENMVELTSGGEAVPEGFYPVQVETGISDNTSVEILSGVEEGDEVFTQNMDDASMDDGMGMG